MAETNLNEAAEGAKKEITLRFSKGLVGKEFQSKSKIDCTEIRIPNQDPEDKRPWQTFVVKANHVHEDQFGKGMWLKVPAEGNTTLSRSVVVGEKPDGTREWGTEKTTITNRELKKLVEAYKERSRESALEKQAAYDTAVNEIMADPKLAEVGKAELLINLTEDYEKVSFTMDQKNEICNHAYQTKDVAKTLTLIQTMSEQMRSGNKEERPRESVMDKLAEKKSEVASQTANAEPREKDRSRENALG